MQSKTHKQMITSHHSRGRSCNRITHATLELRTVEDVMEDSYLRYSMSVIVARALAGCP